jgi:phospholipid transport system substrate-binding protein
MKWYMIKNLILSAVFVTACAMSVFADNAKIDDQEQLKSYVENLIQESHELLHNTSLSDKEMTQKASKLLRTNLYLNWMAKQSLGRNIKSISKEQLKDFTKAYSAFVIDSYSKLVKSYKGEKGKLVRVNKISNNLFMVDTEILSTNDGTRTQVKYLVHELSNKDTTRFLIGDIITEGVSLLDSQRSEFNQILSNKGIDGLISEIKQKKIEDAETK